MIVNLSMWRCKLISWLAGDMPVMLNWHILGDNLPDGITAIYIPNSDERKDVSYYVGKGVLVPAINIIERSRA